MTSLRGRAVIGGILWAAVTILLGFAGLQSFVDQGAEERFDELLLTRLSQVVTAVENVAATNPEAIAGAVGDPVFMRSMSGLYWQVENELGQVFRSASLDDHVLPRPRLLVDAAPNDRFLGPMGDPVRAMSRYLTLDGGSLWHVQVAKSIRGLQQELAGIDNRERTVARRNDALDPRECICRQ